MGPIGLDVQLGETALGRLFPGLRVTAVDPSENAAGGGDFRVGRDSERLLDIWLHADGKVSRVNVASPRIPSVKGPKVGDDFEALAAAGPDLVCMTGPGAPRVSCSLKDLPRVFFVFDGDGIEAAEVRAVSVAEMADRRVHEIWFFGRVRK